MNRYIVAAIAAVLLIGGVLMSRVRGECSLPRQNPSALTAKQWDALFAVAKTLPLPQRIGLWADLAAVDAVYVGDPLGEGPGATPDPDPLSDFARVDCVTYVEQVYALAMSENVAAFPDTLRRIRYRDGQIDYRWRNHYTVSDWLPANAWFIRDVTDEVGGDAVKTMTKTISRGKFFTDKGLKQYANLPDEQCSTHYIPREAAGDALPALKTGDLLIFVIDTPGIIAGHVGIVRHTGATVEVQHASLSAKRVITSPLADYLRNIPARFVGFKVARLVVK